MVAYQAYCMKCKNTVIVRSPKEILMSNGRTRVSGICSENKCDGKLSKKELEKGFIAQYGHMSEFSIQCLDILCKVYLFL